MHHAATLRHRTYAHFRSCNDYLNGSLFCYMISRHDAFCRGGTSLFTQSGSELRQRTEDVLHGKRLSDDPRRGDTHLRLGKAQDVGSFASHRERVTEATLPRETIRV